MSNDPQIYGRDDTILALNDAIENLGDHTTGGVFVRYRKALTTLRDSLAARPIVGVVEGKAVRVGDWLVVKYEANLPQGITKHESLEFVIPEDADCVTASEFGRCRLPTAADFGGKQ